MTNPQFGDCLYISNKLHFVTLYKRLQILYLLNEVKPYKIKFTDDYQVYVHSHKNNVSSKYFISTCQCCSNIGCSNF